MDTLGHKFSSCRQGRLWIVCPDADVDLSLFVTHNHIVDFSHVIVLNIYCIYYNGLSHIWDAICHDNPKSVYAISSFLPTGYQPTVMITGSHAF